MRHLKLTPDKFGTITPPGIIIGSTKGALNQLWHTRGFPVTTVCSHDTASAFLSAGADESTLIISSGTWAIAGIESRRSTDLQNRIPFTISQMKAV